jgi:peptide/nickel transport system permease protein
MTRFFLRRLIHAALLLVGVSVLSFLLLQLAPGEFFSEMRLNPQISPETVDALRARYGLDRPLPIRYARWVASVAHGDFGLSLAYNMPAAPLLLDRAKNTLLLTFTAMVLSWVVAVPLGVWNAYRPRALPARITSAANGFMLAVPELVVALVLLVIAARTGWLPTGGMRSSGDMRPNIGDLARHMFIPVLAIVLGTLPVVLRHVRSAMDEVLHAPFVRAARGHGLPRRVVLYRYALRAAANPLVSLFGFSVATLLSASLLVEVVMSWPGLGPLLLDAIVARDLYVVIGAIVFSTVLLVVGNLIADVLLFVVDPRVRQERA